MTVTSPASSFARIARPAITLTVVCALACVLASSVAPGAPARSAPRAAAQAVGPPSVVSAPIRSVRTKYGTVGYRVVGHGRPLVLIMGLSGSIDAWQPAFIDQLARHHRVIAFDNEGVGASSLRRGTLTIIRMGDDTAAFISALRLRRPDVLGWSMGGFIAQAFAVRHPGAYRRLILCATAPGNGRAVLPSPAIIKLLASGSANIVADLFPSDRARDASQYIAAITRYPHFYLPSAAVSRQQFAATSRWLSGADSAGRHDGRLRGPALIGDGVGDLLTPAGNSRMLAHLIPNARLKLYPDAGHAFLFQDESSWVPMIERFLARGRFGPDR